jgi:polysaccharide biosynthesis protein PslE
MEKRSERTNIQPSVRDIFFVIFKRKKMGLFLFSIIMAAVGTATIAAPRIYQSEAKLYVQLGRETVTMNPGLGQVVQISQSLENQINSEIEMLSSPDVAMGVVEEMGTDIFDEDHPKYVPDPNVFTARVRKNMRNLLRFPSQAIARLLTDEASETEVSIYRQRRMISKQIRDNIKLGNKTTSDSNIITIQYMTDHPVRAHDILAKYIQVYQEKHLKMHASPESFDFFEKESDRFREQLEETEKKIEELKSNIDVGDLPEYKRILSEQIGALEQNLKENEAQTSSSTAKIRGLDGLLETLPQMTITSETSGSPSSAVDDMQKQLFTLKLREQELLSTYTGKSIPVKEIRRLIQQAESLLKESISPQITRSKNEAYQRSAIALSEEQGNLAATMARDQSQRRQLDNLKERQRELNRIELLLNNLERQRDLFMENHKRYSNSLEQTRIDRARDIEKIMNIKVAQAPHIPIEPISPLVAFNLAIGLFFALFASVSLCFFVEYVDDRIDKPQHVEKILGLPLLGSIQKWNQ